MSTQTFRSLEAIVPNKKDIALARQSSKILSQLSFQKAQSIELMIEETAQPQSITLPLSAFKLLITILTQMGEGNAVSLVPIHTELTTQEAAELLNVSRPYFIRLLNEKKIPFRKVGTRRKILFHDLMTYKTKIDQDRCKILDNLTKEAQQLNLGY